MALFGFGFGLAGARRQSSIEARFNPTASYNSAAGVVLAAGPVVTDVYDQSGSADLAAPGSAEPGFTAVNAAYGGQPTIDFDGTQWLDADALAALLSEQSAVTLAWVGDVSDTGAWQFIFSGNVRGLAIARRNVAGFMVVYFGGAAHYFMIGSVDNAVHVHVIRIAAGACVWTVDGVAQGVTTVGTPAPATLPAGGVGSSSVLGTDPMVGSTHRLLAWTSDIGAASAAALAAALLAEIS